MARKSSNLKEIEDVDIQEITKKVGSNENYALLSTENDIFFLV
jgi:hypothetical protein